MGAVVEGGAPIIVRRSDQARRYRRIRIQGHLRQRVGRDRGRRQRYLVSRQRADVSGRVAIVVDNGIATGATTRAALRATRMRNPKKLVRVPVAPTDALAALRSEADEVICLEDHEFFGAIGAYYADFSQVSDETVIDILKRVPFQKLKDAKQATA